MYKSHWLIDSSFNEWMTKHQLQNYLIFQNFSITTKSMLFNSCSILFFIDDLFFWSSMILMFMCGVFNISVRIYVKISRLTLQILSGNVTAVNGIVFIVFFLFLVHFWLPFNVTKNDLEFMICTHDDDYYYYYYIIRLFRLIHFSIHL